jgi:hypothetical protein
VVGNFCTRASGLHVGDIRKGGQMNDKQPYLQAATDPTARADRPPLGNTISGMIRDNLIACHTLLNQLGIKPAPVGMSQDAGLLLRLTWLRCQPTTQRSKNDDA